MLSRALHSKLTKSDIYDYVGRLLTLHRFLFQRLPLFLFGATATGYMIGIYDSWANNDASIIITISISLISISLAMGGLSSGFSRNRSKKEHMLFDKSAQLFMYSSLSASIAFLLSLVSWRIGINYSSSNALTSMFLSKLITGYLYLVCIYHFQIAARAFYIAVRDVFNLMHDKWQKELWSDFI